MNAFPPVDDLDGKKPDLVNDQTLYERRAIKYLAVLDDHLTLGNKNALSFKPLGKGDRPLLGIVSTFFTV